MQDNLKQDSADVDKLVGQAWSQHYHGQNDEAIKSFRQLVEKWPDHIDANYGLSLALKTAGDRQAAGEAFRKTKALVDSALSTESDENARYAMLSRMIEQHLSTL